MDERRKKYKCKGRRVTRKTRKKRKERRTRGRKRRCIGGRGDVGRCKGKTRNERGKR